MSRGPDDDIQALIDLREEQHSQQEADEHLARERASWNRDEDNPCDDND